MKMKIFADFHHGDLYYAFHLLFEKRLGHSLYRPIGMDWFDAGYWRIGDPYPNPRDTAMQYLSTEGYTGPFPVNVKFYREGEVYHVYQPAQDFWHKAITLDTFKRMSFDIVISSIPAHNVIFDDLIKKYQPQAKHICHIGNTDQKPAPQCRNIMSSVHPDSFPINPDWNIVFCRQEFDVEMFRYVPVDYDAITSGVMKRKIISIIHYMQSYPLMQEFQKQLTEFTFEAYGCAMPMGVLNTKREIAAKMREAYWGWFIRAPGFGDGYGGHIFLNWCASGRPLIVRLSDNKRYPPSPILKPDINCIDISNLSVDDAVAKIREYSNPDKHRAMCEAMYSIFKQEVDFDRDAQNVKAFLDALR